MIPDTKRPRSICTCLNSHRLNSHSRELVLFFPPRLAGNMPCSRAGSVLFSDSFSGSRGREDVWQCCQRIEQMWKALVVGSKPEAYQPVWEGRCFFGGGTVPEGQNGPCIHSLPALEGLKPPKKKNKWPISSQVSWLKTRGLMKVKGQSPCYSCGIPPSYFFTWFWDYEHFNTGVLSMTQVVIRFANRILGIVPPTSHGSRGVGRLCGKTWSRGLQMRRRNPPRSPRSSRRMASHFEKGNTSAEIVRMGLW